MHVRPPVSEFSMIEDLAKAKISIAQDYHTNMRLSTC